MVRVPPCVARRVACGRRSRDGRVVAGHVTRSLTRLGAPQRPCRFDEPYTVGADVTPKFLFFALHPQRSLAARRQRAADLRPRRAEVARENGRGGRHSGNVYIQRALTPLMKLANGGSAEHRCGCRKKKTDGHP
ncbi:hypothetical protein EVAR_51194_1 [Eumeta japonica]|uniref:Uncharacterized protein n=1 Tax=Eumeta variegata TaxID=151549 RepID=A0A4C1XB18_EUMVA|nr:hypothetical protein EVAR_51194_1 [Eumeta japonica]